MEVILKQDIEKIGKAGMVIKVKEGYGRNYLIPKGLAVISTPHALKQLQQEQQRKNLAYEKARKEAEDMKTRLAALSLTIPALAKEEDKLYGSVTAADIAAALAEEGLSVDKSTIMLEEPLKAIGIYEVPVKLHSEVTAVVKVWIVKK